MLTPSDAPNTWASRKRIAEVPLRRLAEDSGLAHHALPRDVPMAEWEPPRGLFPPAPAPSSSTGSSSRNVLLTASFGHVIPPAILGLYAPGARLNVHPSLLPQLRGAAPVQWAIARRLARTGVSIQGLEAAIDTGRVFARHALDVGLDEDVDEARGDSRNAPTYETLLDRLEPIAVRLLLEVLSDLEARAAAATPQSELGPASRAPKVRREHAEVCWDRWTAHDIEARHRAFSYLFPLSATLEPGRSGAARDIRVLLRSVRVGTAETDAEAGAAPPLAPGQARLSRSGSHLEVGCAGDTHLCVSQLQTAGKRPMDATHWIVGYRDRADAQTGLLTFT